MNITAIENNFGAQDITLRAYLSERMVILEGIIPVDTSSTLYQSADSLVLTFFAVRGTMQPASPVIADIHLTEDDVEPGEGTATGTFQLRMSSPPSLCSLDAVISRTGDSWVQKVAVRDYPPAAPDDMQFYLPARTPEDTGYRVVMKETFFSRAESMIFLTHIGTREVTEAEIIGTSLMGRLLSM